MDVLKPNTCGFTGIHGYDVTAIIQIPVGVIGGRVDFLDEVGSGRNLCDDRAVILGCERRTADKLGAGSIGVDVELPAAKVFAGVGFLDDLHIGFLTVGECDALGITSNNCYRAERGVIDPFGILSRLVNFPDIVGTGQQLHADLAFIIGNKGRTGDDVLAISVSVDVEFPAAQVLAGVGCLDDLSIAIMGILYGYGCGAVRTDLYRFDPIICDPEIIASIKLLHIVSAGCEAGNGDSAIGAGLKGRTGNGILAGSIRVYTEAPSRHILAGIGDFLDG